MSGKIGQDNVRDELSRLLEGLEFFRSWRIEEVRAATGHVTQDDLDRIVMPSTSFWNLCEQVTERAVLQEVKNWYAHTASDLTFWATSDDPELTGKVACFLTEFRSTVGFDFFEDAGLLRKVAVKALKQGRIANQNDYYVLKELEVNLSQTVLSASDMRKVVELLNGYEGQNT